MTSKHICCLTIRRWSETTAVFQIVLNMGLLVFGIFAYFVRAGIIAGSITSLSTNFEQEHARLFFSALILVGFALTPVSLFGITLGVLLFEGIQDQNYRRCSTWIKCTFLIIFFYLILIIAEIFRAGLGGNDVGFLFGMIIHVLFIIVVRMYIKEMKHNHEQVESIVSKSHVSCSKVQTMV